MNALTDFFLTKLDVLTGWEQIPVCVAYEIDGKRVEELPYSETDFHRAKPVYEMFPGWSEDITGAKSFSDLPKNAQAYVKALEDISGAPIFAISVVPGREETIQINWFLKSGPAGLRCTVTSRWPVQGHRDVLVSGAPGEPRRPGVSGTSGASRPAPGAQLKTIIEPSARLRVAAACRPSQTWRSRAKGLGSYGAGTAGSSSLGRSLRGFRRGRRVRRVDAEGGGDDLQFPQQRVGGAQRAAAREEFVAGERVREVHGHVGPGVVVVPDQVRLLGRRLEHLQQLLVVAAQLGPPV
ncbi:Adenylosuccinate synthetase, organellar chromatophore [Streptomyces hirsutus]